MTWRYDAAGRHTSHTDVQLDRSRTDTTYDVLGQHSWWRVQDFRDANHHLTSQTIALDAGGWHLNQWDHYRRESWWSANTVHDAANRVLNQTFVLHDNKGRTFTEYDAYGAHGWTHYTNTYDANDRLLTHAGRNDDGSTWNRVFDAYGHNPWSEYTDVRDAAGRLLTHSGIHDDGRRWHQYHDVAQVHDWWRVTEDYDAGGRLTQQTINYDNGRGWVNQWDPGNLIGWSTVHTDLNARWETVSQVGYYDDGTSWRNVWDRDNVHRYSWYEEHWNHHGHIIHRRTHWDGGGRMDEHWDHGYTEWWWQIVNYFNSANYLTYGYIVDDFGRHQYYYGPIALDLDGDGLDLRPLERDKGPFDWDGDGIADATDWVGHSDGMLVIDVGNDGLIDQRRELAFTDWAPGTTGDMEALRAAFDSNRDGRLTAADAQWSEFRVWRDQNQNGVTDKKELRTLDEWGITGIDLNPAPTSPTDPLARIVTGTSQFTWADGRTGIAGDLRLSYTPSGGSAAPTDLTEVPVDGPAYRLVSTAADELLSGSNGRDIFVFDRAFGHDVIPVFQAGPGAGDVLLIDRGLVASVDGVLQRARQEENDVVITLESGTITLRNLSVASLHANDFLIA